jgi:chorismate mutase
MGHHAFSFSPEGSMPCRGIRGATTASANTVEAIQSATRELLEALVSANGLQAGDLASVIFSTTMDLNADYPAYSARQLGWVEVPLLCTHEMQVPGGLARCIRVLLHWNTHKVASEVVHVYLRGATILRPDLGPPGAMDGTSGDEIGQRLVIGSQPVNGP